MPISKPAGAPGPPKSAPTGGSRKSRSDKDYGTNDAGFGLKRGGMDGVPVGKKQTDMKRSRANLNPNSDAGSNNRIGRGVSS